MCIELHPSTMSRKVGREGVAYHEDPNGIENGRKGREGVTAGDVESKTETTYQRWKDEIMPSSSEEGASSNATIRYEGLDSEGDPIYSRENTGKII